MGGGGSQQATTQLPPPPPPKIQIDPVTSGAEAALVGAAKDSYASRTETEEEKKAKADLGATKPTQTQPTTRKRAKTPATTMSQAAGLGSSAVLTG